VRPLLQKHPELVKIVLVTLGTSSLERLRENLAAAELTLSAIRHLF
jgi:aryl-alcohol dehydrogenase-like predicted oxidoreductase